MIRLPSASFLVFTLSAGTNAGELHRVARVVDGDTIDVVIDGETRRVRLIGIDTPESVDPRRPVECFGKEATQKMKELVAGRKVRLESDPTQGDKGKYGRLLRYVFLEDGTDVGLKLIKEGYAHEYTYSLPYKYQDSYMRAEREAREVERGLWAPGACLEEAGSGTGHKSKRFKSGTASDADCGFEISYIFYDRKQNPNEPDEYVEIKNTGSTASREFTAHLLCFYFKFETLLVRS